ncbi:enoyl-CoA hydratase/isomerase family protein [Aeromicrobium fastidiosum]|uniref:Enoyl-CoA hydratase/isomerase family protein n=1 Tax=Aeromicrobium fastidiosum TaxID=52699 RepID=A0A641ARF5_9ACTN|nr:enoyl-CoA hydratase-related protein [Aeromicrobium fastidiosum]KAA1380097.1 enoyl-CoA hydratase/isomerase family protein [Aeromicrobium fastidiosum]MBP2389628.1 enoyl-CoA hydratase/carnithine racemase [Aeromicrobium fastidiosum]
MTDFVRYEVQDGLGVITIDRPEKRNALSYAMLAAIRDSTHAAEADPVVKAIVLTGTPGQFCAGTDLTELHDVAPGTKGEDRTQHTDGQHWFLHDAAKPVIAAVDGPAAGLGIELATQCDFRIASTRARFSWIFVQRGLVPDTGAGTWLLPQLVGLQTAKSLVFSGEFIDAAEAERIGFVLDVVEPDDLMDAARALAARVSSGSPFAIARAKRLLNAASALSRDEHLVAHVEAMTECQLSDDHREGVAAFFEKRPAVFTGR